MSGLQFSLTALVYNLRRALNILGVEAMMAAVRARETRVIQGAFPAGITCMDAPGVTTGDSLDQNAQNAPRCVSRSLLRDCELFSHGL